LNSALSSQHGQSQVATNNNFVLTTFNANLVFF
jgi:hypothetical protein